jgi:Cu(I)/Ag(I) efflux system membrane fusion protein
MNRSTLRTLPSIIVALLLLVAVAFRGPLLEWFTGERKAAAGEHAGHAHDAGPIAPAFRFNDGAKQALQVAFSGYEQLRAELARDELRSVPEVAPALASTLEEALTRDPATPAALKQALEASIAAAKKLPREQDLEAARRLFGEVSQGLVQAALEDPRVADGWSLFECPMAEGYKRWLQPEAQMANPYMGRRMLKCGSTLSLTAEAEAWQSRVSSGGDPNAIAYWTCPMHPGVKQGEKGACPLCGMDLVPVTKGDLETGVVTVDEPRRQKLGVKVEEVKAEPFTVTVRTVGEVKFDERSLADVSLQVGGWIRGLKVDTTGQPVKKGQVLFSLYSPELLTAQQEYLLALRSSGGDAKSPLVAASRQRLRLWGVDDAQLDELVKRGAAEETMPIRAPASGVVLEKDVVEGAAVMPGTKLYRIAAVDRVWVEAQVFEADLPYVTVGTPVEVTLPFVPGRTFTGTVAYVYPSLQGSTRTGQLRIELSNREGLLKPQMYADVTFRIDRGVKVTVPTSAIIYTGPRRLVFVDLGEGRLRPREVKLGLRSDDGYEIVSGLAAGERVVTSGNFLVAAESRLRSATEYWGGEIDSAAPAATKPEGGAHEHQH